MLTRLRVTGFKNLVDACVEFGPFTCIAGPNGVGKSNLFDAITFLSDLTRCSIVEAAARVRDPGGRLGDPTALFRRRGNECDGQMSLMAEFIVPAEVKDDFGRPARPSITFLTYEVGFRLRHGAAPFGDGIELAHEKLSHVNIAEAGNHLKFPHVKKTFRDSVVTGRRSGGPFVSTKGGGEDAYIELHGDARAGRPSLFPAATSPKTVVGGQTTGSHPTVLAARREMESWRLLQLEPSALRQPDDFRADPHVAATGGHVPATLLRLGPDACEEVADRLRDLLPELRRISVVRDDQRQLVTAFGIDETGASLPLRALSDGTLRFLALATMAADPESGGVVCLEEPENGIHPARIQAMVRMLQVLAVDPHVEAGPGNPLRQIIVNTHSPQLVREVDEDALLVGVAYHLPDAMGGGTATGFRAMPDTWRAKDGFTGGTMAMGDLMAYLGLSEPEQPVKRTAASRRVSDAATAFQLTLPNVSDSAA